MDDATDTNALSWSEQVQRKAALPSRSASLPAAAADEQQRPRGKSAPGFPFSAAPGAGDDAPPRRRGFSLARHQSVPAMVVGRKSRRRRKVTFKNMYAPDVVPPPKVESYDELVFNVAGLFHTMSFLHDPEDWGEDPTASSLSSEDEFYYDPEPPLERSVPLMIAEFLHRSAVFLGYPQGDTPWLPGFREDKRFSGNDVKRWRRLAHFDWEAEERAFQQNHRRPPPLTAAAPPGLARTESVESNGHTSVMSTIGASFRMRRQDSAVSVDSSTSNSSLRSQDSYGPSKVKFRSAVSGWIRKHRRQHSKDAIAAVAEQASEDEGDEKLKRHGKRKPVSWLNPPPISSSRDLALAVDIINSCVYCGQFQFRKRDIVRLCNVKI
ncbi:hypothetical protein PHYPSEUDO_002609 [Phytophthora pseudosyringae]|uniref:Uncharacterized protein n=1 Tax=Phytophthora pseudosyringae TaxID=221518 RepID=A0A8T1VTB6_9STRA|nr:hypothetical protein PHYPSEUDO_002609 [Phytophthora pseudosyringae]